MRPLGRRAGGHLCELHVAESLKPRRGMPPALHLKLVQIRQQHDEGDVRVVLVPHQPGVVALRLVPDDERQVLELHHLAVGLLLPQAVDRPVKLRPLDPPTADLLEIPSVETVPLQDRFKSVWEAHNCDAEPGKPSCARRWANRAMDGGWRARWAGLGFWRWCWLTE